jgi:heterodisulfide reductase subunit A
VRQFARVIDPKKCTAYGVCAQKCPRKVKDEFTLGLGWRKAAFVRYPQAVPLKYAIDPAKCAGCGLCTGECPMGAIALMHHREKQLGPEIRAACA